MKTQNENRRWNILILLALMAALLRLVVVADSDCTNSYRCAGVSITVDPEHSPAIRANCDKVVVRAWAGASTISGVDAYCAPTSDIWHGGGSWHTDFGTGCEVSKIQTSCDTWEYTIKPPAPPEKMKQGFIRIFAHVNGDTITNCAVLHTSWHTETDIWVEPPPEDDVTGNCSTCSGSGEHQAGTAAVANEGVDVKLNLGMGDPKLDAGYLSIYAEAPSADLARPVLLKGPFERPGVTTLPWTDGTVKQAKSPQGLVHVAVVDQWEYQLQCFYETDVVKDQSGQYVLDVNGYYTTNASPYVTWIVKNPDGATANNRLKITERRGTTDRDFLYTYTASSYRWDLLKPDGQTTISTWKVAVTPGGDTTNYFRETRFGAQVVRKSQETYKWISGLNDTLLTQEVLGDDDATQTTTYTYYSSDPTNGASANKLRRVDRPDGNWSYYKYDDKGRCTNEFAAWLNSAPPANVETQPSVSANRCKLTEYAFTLNLDDDGVDEDDGVNADPPLAIWTPRRTVVKVPDESGNAREIARTYRHFYTATWDVVQVCPEPGGQWGDTENLTTETYRNTDGTLSSVTGPDGTTTYYAYYDDYPNQGFRTTVVQRGNTVTTTEVDELGLVQSETTVESSVTLAQKTYNYQVNGEYMDPLRRSHDVTDLAGRTTQYRYSCCGLDYVVDPDGVMTYTEMDDVLKRQLGVRQVVGMNGATEMTIKTTNQLDAVGAVLTTKRVGTDGSVITLGQYQYDLLGRLARQTNGLGGVSTTTNVISDNRLWITNTAPDGGVRVTGYYRDGGLATTFGTAVLGVTNIIGAEQDGTGGPWRQCTREVKLNSDGTATSEWTKTYVDGAGRSYKTMLADATPASETDNPTNRIWYNNKGQAWKQRDPDGVWALYKYNTEGEREYSVTPIEAPGTVYSGLSDYANLLYEYDTSDPSAPYFEPAYHFGTADRVTQLTRTVVAESGGKPDLVRTDRSVWKDGEYSGTLVSRSETSTDGLHAWQMVYPDASTELTSQSTITNAGAGTQWVRSVTQVAPDGSSVISTYSTNRLISVTRFSSAPAQIARTTYGYDAHGRQSTVSDARNGTTYYGYNNADQVVSVTTPAPGTGQNAQITLTSYNTSLQATNVIQPDDTSVTNEFYANGLLRRTYGSRTYPVAYGYDYAGRMKTMTNWSTFAITGAGAGGRVTTWNYNQYRGWLDSKDYPDAASGNPPSTAGTTGPTYTYTPAGRLATRVWKRGITTTYSYGNAGELSGVNYSDSTTDVTYNYDRLGRQTNVVQGSLSTLRTYNDVGQLLSEAYEGGTLNGLAVTNGYDAYLRRQNVTVSNATPILHRVVYSYDAASRLETVTDETDATSYSATYGYLDDSSLVGTVTFGQDSTTRMTTTRSYDKLNRLLLITNAPSAAGELPIAHAYTYNSANQRTRVTLGDASYWVYEYDALGQVTSGKRYWYDGTPVAGQQFEYGFGDIGNRTQAAAGGDENGANLRTASYGANFLNQYTNRTVPGYVDVLGAALATNSVTVNSQSPYRKGEYFRKELAVGNGATALWTNITVVSGGTSVSGNRFVTQAAEGFGHDADGNLTSDGRWTYTWDAENRLVRLVARTAVGPQQRIDFEYDAQSRRTGKKVWNNTGGTGTPAVQQKFLYDGWNLVAMLDATSALLASFTWGTDLSGSLQGAGGVGGLLVSKTYSGGSLQMANFYGYDGNGNVVALVNAADGTVSARYEYGPFGEPIRGRGTLAEANPFRFSTKFTDNETDLLYYGYRFYEPNAGRWLSRDPISENGGYNLYRFARNNPLDKFDPDGRDTWCPYPYPGHYCSDPKPLPQPQPGSGGGNTKRPGGSAYLWTCGCTSKKDRLSPIPGVSSPSTPPITTVGPGSGTYEFAEFPTTPPSAVGGGGAGPCNILVVKCPGFVGVFHFTVGDSPSGTLGMFSWPSGCSAIICGGDDTGQSNCLGDGVKSAANAAGLNVVGVSGNSGCGVDADGNWWQHGN